MPPLPLPDPELTDDTIRLRVPSMADVPAITEACQDLDIQHFTFVPVPYHEEHARDWVTSAPARAATGEALNLVIADAASRKVAQRAGFVAEDAPHAPITLKGRTWNLMSYSLRPEQVAS